MVTMHKTCMHMRQWAEYVSVLTILPFCTYHMSIVNPFVTWSESRVAVSQDQRSRGMYLFTEYVDISE